MKFFEAYSNLLKRMVRYRLRSIYGKLDGRRKKHNNKLMAFHYLLFAPIFYILWYPLILILLVWYWVFKFWYLIIKYSVMGVAGLFRRMRSRNEE